MADVPADFTHLDPKGRARMVDVTDKAETSRRALARAVVRLGAEVRDRLFDGDLPKGDALAVARIAGIQGAKDTSRTIPLCHPLPIRSVEVSIERFDPEGGSAGEAGGPDPAGRVEIRCEVRCQGPTGVEMEALCGASAAALALYDMCKALDKGIVLGPIELLEKDGGKSGAFRRSPSGSAD